MTIEIEKLKDKFCRSMFYSFPSYGGVGRGRKPVSWLGFISTIKDSFVLKGTMSRYFHSLFWSDKIIFSLRETSQ